MSTAVRRVTAVLAEDEPVLRADLQSRLATLWPALKVVDAAASGVEALELYDQKRPDIVFLDIEMPGLDGLQVAQKLAGRCHVVFLTAYDAHAIAAFVDLQLDWNFPLSTLPYMNLSDRWGALASNSRAAGSTTSTCRPCPAGSS